MGGSGSGLRAALAATGGVQKTAKGAPAYSRFVNRRLGRFLAAVAYVAGMTPNQVTLISAGFSYASIVAVAVFRPSVGLALGVSAGLVLGYAFDSADGQLARLRGGGSPAGEWLDHMVDCLKISALHVAVLVSFYRFSSTARPAALLLPAAFGAVATLFFFGMILTDQLRRADRANRPPAPAAPAPASQHSVVRSLAVLPADYGVMCLIFLALAAHPVFLALYFVLFVGMSGLVAVLAVRWYREIASFRPGTSAVGG